MFFWFNQKKKIYVMYIHPHPQNSIIGKTPNERVNKGLLDHFLSKCSVEKKWEEEVNKGATKTELINK